jgi:flagellar protein FliS
MPDIQVDRRHTDTARVGSKEPAMGAALAYAAYRHAEVETLTQRDLLVKLFEGMERFIEQGAAAIRERRYDRATECCRRVREILFELISTLNHDAGEIATRLNALYVFLVDQVSLTSMRKDADGLLRLKRTVTLLREGWQGVPDEFANTTSLTGAGTAASVVSMRG